MAPGQRRLHLAAPATAMRRNGYDAVESTRGQSASLNCVACIKSSLWNRRCGDSLYLAGSILGCCATESLEAARRDCSQNGYGASFCGGSVSLGGVAGGLPGGGVNPGGIGGVPGGLKPGGVGLLPGGVNPGGALPGGVKPGGVGALPGGVKPGGAGALPGGAEPGGAGALPGGVKPGGVGVPEVPANTA